MLKSSRSPDFDMAHLNNGDGDSRSKNMLLAPNVQPVFARSLTHATPQVSKPRGHSKGAFDAWSSYLLVICTGRWYEH